MKPKLLFLIFLAVFWLTACASTPGTAPMKISEPQPFAQFTEVANQVLARTSTDVDFSAAQTGDILHTGGQSQTATDSRARLDLFPEDTVIRLGPNTEFTLQERQLTATGPLTRLQLLGGQIWVLLSGGQLDVETPLGNAGVRGSMLSVTFDDQNQTLEITCLEGHCSLENDLGYVELSSGQAASIPAPEQPPTEPHTITPEEQDQWTQEVPEAQAFIEQNIIIPPQEGFPPPPPGYPPPEDIVPPPTGQSNQPAPGSPPPPGQGSSPPSNAQLTTYHLTNNCDEDWHWRFEGPTTITIDLAPGESANGELPPGTYQATDWTTQNSHGPDPITSPGGGIDVTGCPGN